MMIELPYQGTEVSTVDNPTRDEFRELVARADIPFKVTGAVNHWRLVETLGKLANPIEQLDYLSSLHKKRVHFSVVPPEQKGTLGLREDFKHTFSRKTAPFPVFADTVKASLSDPSTGTVYLQSRPIAPFGAELGALDLFAGLEPLSPPRFWIGSGRQKVALHNDPHRNVIAVVAGRKRVILAPPEELPNLYPAPFDHQLGGVTCSQVDVYAPDFEKYPRFRDAAKKIRIAVLEPGEFLYMPPLWWHAVESDTFNVGINCWFFDDGSNMEVARICYFPGRRLLDGLDKITEDERRSLRNLFFQTLEQDRAAPAATGSTLARKVVNTARSTRASIEGTGLTDEQQKLWRGWVQAFCDWYVFRVNGNPYPTLAADEHQRMLRRLKQPKNVALQANMRAVVMLCRFRALLRQFKAAGDDGIVPWEDRRDQRLESGKSPHP